MVQGFYSDSTCNEACWFAKEDVCRCVCGGANHGIYKRDPNAPQPQRMKREKTRWYRLYTVCSYFDAHDIERAFYDVAPRGGDRWWDHPARNIKISKLTDAQALKWPEAKAFFMTLDALKAAKVVLARGDIEPYAVWIPNDLTPEWIEEHPIKFESRKRVPIEQHTS